MDIKALLREKLGKYGTEEYICSAKELEGAWEKSIFVLEKKPKRTDDIWIRTKLLPVGRIIEEDLKAHTYTLVFEICSSQALAVTMVEGDTLHIAAYAKDKLFVKGTAENAAQIIANRMD